MNAQHSRTPRFRPFADVIGPSEVNTLARTVPSLETDELARIVRTAAPANYRSQP
jgi:hypothetical protein